MRILLTADAVGGVWQYATDLARAFGSREVETVIALLGPPPSAAQRAEAAAIPGARLVETGRPLDWLSDGPAPILAAGAAIAELAGDEHVDLVQLNMPSLSAAAPPPVPVLAVAHGCIASWWQATCPGEPLPRAFHWHRSLTGEGLRAADMVAAPSAGYARMVARLYGLPRTPAVVHNGRAFAPLANGAMQDCVFTAGRLWDRAKNAALLDRVAGRLAVPFHAAGPVTGPHGEAIDLRHLHLLGSLDAAGMARQLACRPVFVSAARFEPFGLAVLEAAAAGSALVLSDMPVFRELWDGSAQFVAGEDEAAWTRAIESVIGDTRRRLRLGAAARERAARYTADAMVEAMAGLYARMVAHHSAGRVAA
ncbi:glycosyltransferase family 4 protein [Sphingomonas sp. DT-204]|uniref:glycosyltransferase family 4 protein n=1 Tax=Sphingomonas sp. DT-204 TaxID=3396166 RepID=UPI003F53F7D6